MLADKLKKIREEKGFSKLELARRTGLTARTIENIEYGKNENPQIGTLRKLANALEISIHNLIS